MGIFKIIIIIIMCWFLIKSYRFINRIKIHQSKKNNIMKDHKIHSNIQDAEYEDVD